MANEDSRNKSSETQLSQEDAYVKSQDPVLRVIPPEERDRAWALWQKAARSSAENMFEDCSYWISRLQPRKRGLTPEECFHLWSYLGELRFHLWSKTLPKEEVMQISAKSESVQRELSEAVVRYTSPHAQISSLLVRLETQMTKVIQDIHHHIVEAKQLLQKNELAESWDQTEFDVYIQTPMDQIGYTLELLKAMKLSLSPRALEAQHSLEKSLRSIFPAAVNQYRESGHSPIDAGRPVWPDSFWWRYNGGVRL